jgi:molybdenum cofactor cytidylyltransferase
MGRPKLLLPWGEASILGHLLNTWRDLGAKQIAVLCALNDAGINAELDRFGFPQSDRIVNSAPECGMFSSIQCAAAWPGWQAAITHLAIVLGDQPHLRLETLQAILDFSATNPNKICQPRKDGHRYHPVLLPRDVFERLTNSTADNLKDFLQSCGTAYCEINDPGLELDIDRPEDYQRALDLAKLARPESP